MRVSIIGTGYVGLVTGACLAEKGHYVTCVDVDSERVAALNRAESPIYEAGLDELLRRNVGRTLFATVELAAAVRESELTLISVGTPFNGREIDVSAVLRAAEQVGSALRSKTGYHVVVVKSTVVPGTTDQRVFPVLEVSSGKRVGSEVGLAMNPEFLSEGDAVRDFMWPDRLVLGGIDQRSIEMLARLYEAFPSDVPRLRTNTRTAEMIKYASNALLATLISFSNEFANLGSAIGDIDIVEVMRGVHLSQYFRTHNADGLPPITTFLAAGCGFGGSCLPKDVSALIAHGDLVGSPMPLLQAVIDRNREQPRQTVALLRRRWPQIKGKRVAVLGLAFKPGTSDVRESPAFAIIHELLHHGADVRAYDPVAMDEARKVLADSPIRYESSLEAALKDVDGVVVVTPWKEFADVPHHLKGRQSQVVLVDARRSFDPESVPLYEGIGL
jgi:UDPglucose 6-dehydrogenase